jgi:hypothetical protein
MERGNTQARKTDRPDVDSRFTSKVLRDAEGFTQQAADRVSVAALLSVLPRSAGASAAVLRSGLAGSKFLA